MWQLGFLPLVIAPNVINGLQMAKAMGITPIGLSGGDGGKLNSIANPLVLVPSDVTSRIQEAHIMIGHVLCSSIERYLGVSLNYAKDC